MKRFGKKAKKWKTERTAQIRDALLNGRFMLRDGTPFGTCVDCASDKYLTPDHRKKRSQGGSHGSENIDWVCWECHDKRDNQGDPMNKKDKAKKPEWTKEHTCINCKQKTSFFLCHQCKHKSIK